MSGIDYSVNLSIAPKEKLFVKQPPISDVKLLSQFVQDYIDQGFISQMKREDLLGSFPIKLVPKKNGSYRIVHDLRNLNNYFMPPRFNLPTPMAPCVLGHRWAAKVDIKNCFLHFPLEEKFSRHFGFQIEGKCFKFNVLPFGWNMSPYLVMKFLQPVEFNIRS